MAPVKSKRYKQARDDAAPTAEKTSLKAVPLPEKTSPPVEVAHEEHLPVPSDTTKLPANALPTSPSDRNLLHLYLQEMAKTPLLKPEEERELAVRVHDFQDKEALKRLVQSNLRFVVKIAFEYARYGAKVLDLIQEGNMGLLRAVRDFNPYKDTRLTTYAVWWIRSYIHDYLMRNWSMVRIGTTAAQKKLFYRLRKEQEKYEREGRRPEVKAIAMNLGVEEDDVKMMQQRLSGRDISLSPPENSEQESSASWNLHNRVADPHALPSQQLEASEQAALFHKALEEFRKELDERELTIFKERLLSESPRTLQEIGDEYGFTKERARQLEERVKNKLKDFLAANYPDISLN